jgi:dephospho-CoA kinase
MIRIGLTGSIAMGKSEVARVFEAHRIPVFDADGEVHVLYESAHGAELLKREFPTAIVDDRVDRTRLSALVTANPQRLLQLEALVHGEIQSRRERFFTDAKARGEAMAVADIPLLFEKGSQGEFDLVIVVSAPASFQRGRALKRPGMTPAKLDMILSRQMPDEEKRRRADIVLENDGSLAELQAKTEQLIIELRKRGEK